MSVSYGFVLQHFLMKHEIMITNELLGKWKRTQLLDTAKYHPKTLYEGLTQTTKSLIQGNRNRQHLTPPIFQNTKQKFQSLHQPCHNHSSGHIRHILGTYKRHT